MRYPKVVKYGSMEYNTMVANQRNAEAALEKQKAEKMADEVAEKRQERRFQVMHTLFTIIATLFVEHFVEIVKFVCEFFQSLFT